jgi:hypothetical protein
VSLVLPPAARAGFTFVAGTVADANTHKGIAALDVCLYPLSKEWGYYCDTTGPQGKWGLKVAEDRYRIEFKGNPLGYVSQFYDHEIYRGAADPVTVGSTEVTGIDGELVEGGEIRGEVTEGASGDPLAQVEACAREVDTAYLFACGDSDSSGAYAIKGLPSGEFEIEFRPLSEYLADQFFDHRDYPWEVEPVAVNLGEVVDGIDAAISTGASIEGTVSRNDGGIVSDQVGICARASYGYEACAPAIGDGVYQLPGLSPGKYIVEFFSYFNQLKPQFWDHASSSAEAKPILLGMSEVATGIDADMEAVPAPLKPTFTTPSFMPPETTPSTPMSPPTVRHKKHCRKGFHKRRKAGKMRCLKKHKRHRRG